MAVAANNNKSHWMSMVQTVQKFHGSICPLSRKIPLSLSLREEATRDGIVNRVYFLSPLPGQRENTIMYVDIPISTESDTSKELPWKMLLDPQQALSFTDNVSPEEQLLRERKRIRTMGIASYDFLNYRSSGTFAFSANNTLYTCSDALLDGRLSVSSITAKEIPTNSTSSRLDVKLCPCNPNLVAYISGSNLWMSNISTNVEHQLTFVGKDSKDSADSNKTAGVASYVVQEEFDRCTGYWWQPSCDKDENGLCVYRLLYEEVDESEVSVLNIVPPNSNGERVDTYRYPRAGTMNAKSDVKIIEFRATASGDSIQDIKHLTLPKKLVDVFPRMEYLLRAGWVPNSSWIYVEVIDRRQTFLQLALLDLKSFTERNKQKVTDTTSTLSGQLVMDDDPMSEMDYPLVIFEESSKVWVRVHNLLHFISTDVTNMSLSFIRGTEKSGFLHLYLITSRTGFSQEDRTTCSYGPYGKYYKATIAQEISLTSGDWEVDVKQLWVNERRKLVYFVGYKDTPLESHLYATSYGVYMQQPARLSELGYSHSIEMNQECSVYSTVFNSLNSSTECRVYAIHATENGVFTSKCVAKILGAFQIPSCIIPPELFSYVSPTTGYTMHGLMYKPPNFDPTRKYPVVMFVYGGPQFQLVMNTFRASRLLRLHILASVGFIIVMLDGRGSDHRGLKFASDIKHKLGTVEVDDQVEGLKWLASKHQFIDMNRIGIHGWSYGGYLSLKCFIKHPNIFKVAVAGAPVTDWNLYDTGYTERYLDLPINKPEAYRASSVVDHVEKFPNEKGRLLIIQGLMDENVHFYHTSSLVDALIKACKPHEVQIYPNERHGIRSSEANQHYETMLVSFLKQNL